MQNLDDLEKLVIQQSLQGYIYHCIDADLDQGIYYNLQNPNVVISCDTCERNITHFINFLTQIGDYCISCFAKATTFHGNYRVANHFAVKLFEAEWTAEQELLLIQGIERIGFDWEAIAEEMEFQKDPEQGKYHYQECYLGNGQLLPQTKLQQFDYSAQWHSVLRDSTEMQTKIEENGNKGQAHERGANNACLNAQNLINEQQGISLIKRKRSNRKRTSFSNVLRRRRQKYRNIVLSSRNDQKCGFFPKHGEFEYEYDNDAELLLSELQFLQNEPIATRIMKQEILEEYNRRLQMRNAVKDFAFNRKIIDFQHEMHRIEVMGYLQKRVDGMMKVFARFVKQEDYQILVQRTAKFIELQRRIAELKQYKQRGFKTLEQAQSEEQNPKTPYFWDVKQLIDNKFYYKTRKNYQKVKQTTLPQKQEFMSDEQFDLCQRWNLPIATFAMARSTILLEKLKDPQMTAKALMGNFRIGQDIVQGIYRHMKAKKMFDMSAYYE